MGTCQPLNNCNIVDSLFLYLHEIMSLKLQKKSSGFTKLTDCEIFLYHLVITYRNEVSNKNMM